MTIAEARPRTDPEDPLAIPAVPIVEWFRVDATRRIARYLAIGATGMAAGSFSIARLVMSAPHAAMVASRSPTRHPVLWPASDLDATTTAWAAIGFALVIVCGLVAIVGLNRVLREESYLALRVDGVLFVHGDARRFLRWEQIDDVLHDRGRDAIVLVRDDGERSTIAQRFAGGSSAEIVQKALAVRRRALFGLYG